MSSNHFNKWLKRNGGADFIRAVQSAIFDSKKVQGDNNSLGELAYGTNELGKPAFPASLLSQWENEALYEAILQYMLYMQRRNLG